jgi:hypothetical protein
MSSSFVLINLIMFNAKECGITTEGVGLAVTLLTRIREVLSSNLSQDIGYPD